MNEWTTIAKQAQQVQDAKNRVLNGRLFSLIHKYVPGKGRAFDYGSGWGEFAEVLAEDAFEVEAFDVSDEMVEEARARYEKPHFYTNAEFQTIFPEVKHRYDLVVSNLVLCILPAEEQDRMLENIKHLVKPDAPLIVSFCHPCTDYLTVGVVSKRLRSHTWNPKYDQEFQYQKIVHENGIKFSDYHRPLEYYSALFKRHELEVVDLVESDVLGTEAHPDFIIFVLRRKP